MRIVCLINQASEFRFRVWASGKGGAFLMERGYPKNYNPFSKDFQNRIPKLLRSVGRAQLKAVVTSSSSLICPKMLLK